MNIHALTALPAACLIAAAIMIAFSSSPLDPKDQKDPEWLAFTVDSLRAERFATERNYLPFLNVSTMDMGLYELPAGGTDPQPVHERDETYYVVAGKAELLIENERIDVSAGSIVYVRAGVEHRFENIQNDLSVLVFFSSATPDN